MAKEEMINLQRLEDYSSDMFRDANVLKRKTAYALNNVVCKGLIILKCILAGTTNTTTLSLSGVSVGDELTDGTAKWKVISVNGYGTGGGTGAGLEDWESNHDYAVDDIYVYEGEIYKVLVAFTSGATEDERTKVNDVVPSVWTANTAYTAGDIIEYTDVTTLKKVYYNVTSNFTSGATFEVTAEMQELQIVEEYVPNPLTKQQVKNLIDNFVPSGSGTDPIFYNDSPIGTIIAYMGITAPKDYLACDGQIYNIVDYKELAEYIKVQFGSYNYFGGDGTTTFAVPDLRGEFLRGAGTNSHSEQGNGSSVGSHQDSTILPEISVGQNATQGWLTGRYNISGNSNLSSNHDYEYKIENGTRSYISVPTPAIAFTTDTGTQVCSYTLKPTNTSVLYCIKYNTSVLSTPENNYSTEEQRIGTWIDGKSLYQRVFLLNEPLNISYTSWTETGVSITDNNILDVIFAVGYYFTTTDSVACYPMLATGNIAYRSSIALQTARNGSQDTITAFMLQYTKTTD